MDPATCCLGVVDVVEEDACDCERADGVEPEDRAEEGDVTEVLCTEAASTGACVVVYVLKMVVVVHLSV